MAPGVFQCPIFGNAIQDNDSWLRLGDWNGEAQVDSSLQSRLAADSQGSVRLPIRLGRDLPQEIRVGLKWLAVDIVSKFSKAQVQFESDCFDLFVGSLAGVVLVLVVGLQFPVLTDGKNCTGVECGAVPFVVSRVVG
jgi:hypothetical protein